MQHKVYRSLCKPDLILGIPKNMLIIIMTLTIILVYLINFWCVFAALIFYMPVYLLTKRDPDMFNIMFDYIMDPDFLEG